MFLKISQNPHESTCARVSFFNKVAALIPATLFKKEVWRRSFPVNFLKFLKTSLLQNISGRLLLIFTPPENIRKPLVFLTVSVSIEIEQWPQMVKTTCKNWKNFFVTDHILPYQSTQVDSAINAVEQERLSNNNKKF